MSRSEGRILPPIVEELAGKTWPELYLVASSYLTQADTIYLKAPDPTPPEVFEERRTLLSRFRAIHYQADILRAIEIFDSPDPTPADRRFATRVAWAVKVNKRLQSRLPTHPLERATLSQSGIDNQLPPPENITDFERRYRSTFTKIARTVLEELPDPERIVFHPTQIISLELPEG